jgi:hypothetical protein
MEVESFITLTPDFNQGDPIVGAIETRHLLKMAFKNQQQQIQG